MNCSPSELSRLSRCWCLPVDQQRAVELVLLCSWANSITPPCTLPSKVTTPSPVNGATLVLPYAPVLSWLNGGGATSYNVYFNGALIGNQAGTTYAPGLLAFDTAFTWRVDAVNVCGTTTGDTWTFTTIAQFSYAPATATIIWTDKNGAGQTGNLAFFNAHADFASVSQIDLTSQGLTSIANLGALPALSILLFGGNNGITAVDLTANSALTNVQCQYCGTLTALDTSLNPALAVLYAPNCAALATLDISNNPLMSYFRVHACKLPVLVVNTSLNNLASFGLTGGTCQINGQTPAAPPSVGPPNGIVAKAALLAKVPPWSVTTD